MLSAALFAELGLNPGASVGLSYALRDAADQTVSVTLFGGPKVAGYLHPGSHSRLLAQLEGGVRLSGWDLDVEMILGGGGTRMFRASPTYALVDGELVVLETSGHSPMFNQPDAVADSVLTFTMR